MAKGSDGSSVFVIIGVVAVIAFVRACDRDPTLQHKIFGAAKSGVDFLAAAIGLVFVIFGGGGAIMVAKEGLSGNVPFEEWGWRFLLTAAIGIVGIWMIGHAT